jgi:hypothetical protein
MPGVPPLAKSEPTKRCYLKRSSLFCFRTHIVAPSVSLTSTPFLLNEAVTSVMKQKENMPAFLQSYLEADCCSQPIRVVLLYEMYVSWNTHKWVRSPDPIRDTDIFMM